MKALARKQPSNETFTRRRVGIKQTPVPKITTIPVSPTGSTFLQPKLLCPCGGGCPHCQGIIQAKLTIGQPNDKYEQEADRVADAVMHMPELGIQLKPTWLGVAPSCGNEGIEEDLVQTKPIVGEITPLVQRQIESEEEEEIIQYRERTGKTQEVTPKIEAHIQSLKGGGQALPESVRTFFEPPFRRDFSWIRVHTDARAAEIARAVKARAFTVGNDVVFGPGQYAPETINGKRLLAHELTHSIQQQTLKKVYIAKKASCSNAKFEKSRKMIDYVQCKGNNCGAIAVLFAIYGVKNKVPEDKLKLLENESWTAIKIENEINKIGKPRGISATFYGPNKIVKSKECPKGCTLNYFLSENVIAKTKNLINKKMKPKEILAQYQRALLAAMMELHNIFDARCIIVSGSNEQGYHWQSFYKTKGGSISVHNGRKGWAPELKIGMGPGVVVVKGPKIQ